jgi:hypothetical protein
MYVWVVVEDIGHSFEFKEKTSPEILGRDASTKQG